MGAQQKPRTSFSAMLAIDGSSVASDNGCVKPWSRNRSFMLRITRNREKQKKKEIERQKKLEEQL